MRYDVFISYKNDGSGEIFAEKLARDLKEMGYSVYFNSHERRSGPFDERIRQAVAECKDFIAVVSKGYLDQLLHPDETREDWIREELLEARRNATAIITPVYLKGIVVPTLASFAGNTNLSFFPALDGVEMPGEGYDVSPLDSLTSRLVSRKEGVLDYRDVANGNPDLQAADLLRKAYDGADQGDFEAMCRIGMMFYYAMCPHPDGGAVRDFGEAYRWLSRVADECPDEGLRDIANLLIARMYYQGEGTPEGQDYQRSFEHHVLSESIPYSAAQEAFMRKMGFGCDYDFEAIERYYQRIIDSGDVIARLELARFYESHGMFGKAESAYLSMDPMSVDGHYGVGMLYATGNHVNPPSPDFARASYHLQQAADGGHVRAMVELGHLYFRPSRGFTKNFHKAMGCYEEAARLGDITAQYMMGYMLEYGHVRRDIEESIRYFELAAAKGHVLSSEHLAMLYQLPEVCNYSLAFKHCKAAAEGGDSHAEFMLGSMLLFGRGCAYDVDAAKRYYLRAISHGYTPAQQMLDLLMEHDKGGTSSRPSWL